jgi:hypothetical protein
MGKGEEAKCKIKQHQTEKREHAKSKQKRTQKDSRGSRTKPGEGVHRESRKHTRRQQQQQQQQKSTY